VIEGWGTLIALIVSFMLFAFAWFAVWTHAGGNR